MEHIVFYFIFTDLYFPQFANHQHVASDRWESAYVFL